ncbi:hypothetical protein BDP27DRAFT_589643 [Rhodocollybia butyracea]|uniref:Uncharacterized protein n=1 Tax=Rhodocollybia butyracea TaxID=206335 RepID=A0A9P5PQZ3_9AGAR|nr:hypothetical protein BDP27DRAFT_589643 [Rhodocollybia butyracea]
MITLYIRCFGLVFFAALISAVHAMPTPPPGPVAPVARIHPPSDAASILPRKEWPGKHLYRITVLGDEDWTHFPPIATKRKNAISEYVAIAFAEKLEFPPNRIQYINPSDDNIEEELGKIVIFVFEAKDNTVVCGEWPCLGFQVDQVNAFTTVFHMDPNVKNVDLLRYGKDGINEGQVKRFEAAFWGLCPRATFEEKWPELKRAIDLEHKAIIAKQKSAVATYDRERYRKKADTAAKTPPKKHRITVLGVLGAGIKLDGNFPLVKSLVKRMTTTLIFSLLNEGEEERGTSAGLPRKFDHASRRPLRYTNLSPPNDKSSINSNGEPTTNPNDKSATNPEGANTNAELTNNLVVFVFEAKDDTTVCGKYRCVGWYDEQWPAFARLYHMDPNVQSVDELQRFRPDWVDEEKMKPFDAHFWKRFPRGEFEKKWPELMDNQHEGKRKSEAVDQGRNKKQQLPAGPLNMMSVGSVLNSKRSTKE